MGELFFVSQGRSLTRTGFADDLEVVRGDRPFLIPVTKIEAIDINESIDFVIANAISQELEQKKSSQEEIKNGDN